MIVEQIPFAVLGISHKTAPVQIREQVALSIEEQQELLTHLTSEEATHGALVLSTCNRTEVYLSSEHMDASLSTFFSWFEKHKSVSYFQNEYAYLHTGYEALRHFFKVISSLDSQIVGETQITGQVKEAYHRALELGATDSLLNKVFNFGIQAQKKVRNDTYLCQGAVSISFAGVELAEKIFSRLQERSVLLVGAGETAELCAEHFRKKGVSQFHIVNRTLKNAQALAERFHGKAFAMHDLQAAFANVDIVISATSSPDVVLPFDLLNGIHKHRKTLPLFLIDLAVPRDIDPAINKLDDVYLYNLDDLTEIVHLNTQKRANELPKASKIIESVLKEFEEWFATYSLSSTISKLKTYFQTIFHNEIKRATKDITVEAQPALEALEKNLTNKLLRQHIKLLKKNGSTTDQNVHIEMIHKLFEMEEP